MEKIDNTKLRETYTIMVRIQAFEERVLAEYRKGLPVRCHDCNRGQPSASRT